MGAEWSAHSVTGGGNNEGTARQSRAGGEDEDGPAIQLENLISFSSTMRSHADGYLCWGPAVLLRHYGSVFPGLVSGWEGMDGEESLRCLSSMFRKTSLLRSILTHGHIHIGQRNALNNKLQQLLVFVASQWKWQLCFLIFQIQL